MAFYTKADEVVDLAAADTINGGKGTIRIYSDVAASIDDDTIVSIVNLGNYNGFPITATATGSFEAIGSTFVDATVA